MTLIIILLALATFLIFVAWRHGWDWSATLGALAAFAVAMWKAFEAAIS